MVSDDHGQEPTRESIEAMPGAVLVEFGTTWCGHCQALAPQLASLLEKFPDVRHIKVEDGRGKLLGRTFHVKLWPTLVFLIDGRVQEQLVRPNPDAVLAGLESIAVPGTRQVHGGSNSGLREGSCP